LSRQPIYDSTYLSPTKLSRNSVASINNDTEETESSAASGAKNKKHSKIVAIHQQKNVDTCRKLSFGCQNRFSTSVKSAADVPIEQRFLPSQKYVEPNGSVGVQLLEPNWSFGKVENRPAACLQPPKMVENAVELYESSGSSVKSTVTHEVM